MPRNILERILNLIHPHREKVDEHPASDVIFRGAQCLIPLLPISLSFRSLPSGSVSVVVFSLGLLAPTCLRHRLSNTLAALHLSCLSYNPVYFGHGHPHRTHSRLAPDVSHLGHHSVATFIPRSLVVHSLSISFHPSMCHYHGSIIIMLSQHCIGISYYLGCPTALGLV